MARTADPLYCFDVVVAAVNPSVLGRVAGAAEAAGGLPRYGSGLRWQALLAPSRARRCRCELAVVLAESEADVGPASLLAVELAASTPTVVMLAPHGAVASSMDVRGVLIITGPNDDAFSNLVLFSHAALAPVHATALADLDWADVRTIMAGGSRAELVAGRGACAEASLRALEAAMELSAPETWHGALGSIASRHGCRMDWHSRLCTYAGRRSDELIVIGMTMIEELGAETLATMLAITRSHLEHAQHPVRY